MDMPEENTRPIELQIPVEEFWRLEQLIKQLDFYRASNEPKEDIDLILIELYSLAGGRATFEKDRVWLRNLLTSAKNKIK